VAARMQRASWPRSALWAACGLGHDAAHAHTLPENEPGLVVVSVSRPSSALAATAAEPCFPRQTTAARPALPLALTSLHLSPSSLPLIAALNAGPPAARGQVAARRRGRLADEGTSRSSPPEEAGRSPLGLRPPTRPGSAPHRRPAASPAPARAHCEDGKRSREIFVKPGTFA
jgi:hypothetical protein